MKLFAIIICLIGHQITTSSSSDSIACDGDIDTPYNCYQCFDAVARKYFWGSSCKAKKLASADMMNGKCGLDYTCVTKDIGTCPYNDYCPDNTKTATPFGQNFKQGNFWSPNEGSVYKFALPDIIKALKESEQHTSDFVGYPLKLVADVKVQVFNDKTLRVKLNQILFYSNGSNISLEKAHQILKHERSYEGGIGHTVKTFKKMLTMPFLLHTKRGMVKKIIVSQNEPAEVTEMKKLIASNLEKKRNHVRLQLIMKKAIIVPLKTPRFPMIVDIEGSNSFNSEWQSKSESGHNANRPHVALGMRNNMTTSNSNIGYGSQGKCVDTNNDFTDYEGNSCEWYEWEYDYCGDYDDDDFDADKMCCSCGGGYDPPTHRGASCNGQKGAKNNPDCKPGETCVSRFMYIGECKVV